MKMKRYTPVPLVLLTFCLAFSEIGNALEEGASMVTLKLTSTSFEPNGVIPARYTCEGKDISPSLQWSDPPSGTKSLALISEDPDAPGGTWVHWVLYDLPQGTRELKEGVPKTSLLQFPDGAARQGTTDFKRLGYGGPCPPPGSYHRYFFKLYAIDTILEYFPDGMTKQELLKAMEGHILAQGELIGRYKR